MAGGVGWGHLSLLSLASQSGFIALILLSGFCFFGGWGGGASNKEAGKGLQVFPFGKGRSAVHTLSGMNLCTLCHSFWSRLAFIGGTELLSL